MPHRFRPRPPMRRFFLAPLLAGAAACASKSQSPSSETLPSPSERMVAVDDQNIYRTTVLPNAKVPIPAPPGRVFEAVKAVYEELEIPPGTHDPTTGRIGHPDFWKQ